MLLNHCRPDCQCLQSQRHKLHISAFSALLRSWLTPKVFSVASMLTRLFRQLMYTDDTFFNITDRLDQGTLLQLCLVSSWMYDLVAPEAYQSINIHADSHFDWLIHLLDMLVRLSNGSAVEDTDKTVRRLHRSAAAFAQTHTLVFRLDPTAEEFDYGRDRNQRRDYSASHDSSFGSDGFDLDSSHEAFSFVDRPVSDVTGSPDSRRSASEEYGRHSSSSATSLRQPVGLEEVNAPPESPPLGWQAYAAPDMRHARTDWQKRYALWRENVDLVPRRRTLEFLRNTRNGNLMTSPAIRERSQSLSSSASWRSDRSLSDDSESMMPSVPASRIEVAEQEEPFSSMADRAEKFRGIAQRLSILLVLRFRHRKSAGTSPPRGNLFPIPFVHVTDLTIEPLNYQATGVDASSYGEPLPAAFPRTKDLHIGIEPCEEAYHVWLANFAELSHIAPRVQEIHLGFFEWSMVDHVRCSHISSLPWYSLRAFPELKAVHAYLYSEYKGKTSDSTHNYEMSYGQSWGGLAVDLLVRMLIDACLVRDSESMLSDAKVVQSITAYLPARGEVQWRPLFPGYLLQLRADQRATYGDVKIEFNVKYLDPVDHVFRSPKD